MFIKERSQDEAYPLISLERLDNMISAILAPLVLAYIALGTPVARQTTREYTVYNHCPTSIDLYIGGAKQGTIPTGGNVVKTLGTDAGFFYTDANGGDSTAVGTIRAGFYEVGFEYLLSPLLLFAL